MNLLDELICGPVMAPLTTLVILLTSLRCDSRVSPIVSLYYTIITSFLYFYTVCPSFISDVCSRATAQSSEFTISIKELFGRKLPGLLVCLIYSLIYIVSNVFVNVSNNPPPPPRLH